MFLDSSRFCLTHYTLYYLGLPEYVSRASSDPDSMGTAQSPARYWAALTVFRGELFGRKRFASITGISMVITNSLSLIGPVFTGLMFDVTGGYLVPFLVLSVLSLLAAFLILIVRVPKPRQREVATSP